MKDNQYNVLSIDGTLFALNESNDHYLKWLSSNDFPPKSYLKHPLNSESELNEYKKLFLNNFKISLGAFIRIKRVFFILNNTKNYENNILNYSFIETPIGLMLCICSEKGLCLLEFIDRKMLETEINELIGHHHSNLVFKDNKFSLKTKKEIQMYFDKKLKKFNIKLDMIGTDFQKNIWKELINIEYGKTLSYSEQSLLLNMPNSTRAVANANGKNKISIIIPCHRVLKQDKQLGGYGGGIYRKRYLLDLEKS